MRQRQITHISKIHLQVSLIIESTQLQQKFDFLCSNILSGEELAEHCGGELVIYPDFFGVKFLLPNVFSVSSYHHLSLLTRPSTWSTSLLLLQSCFWLLPSFKQASLVTYDFTQLLDGKQSYLGEKQAYTHLIVQQWAHQRRWFGLGVFLGVYVCMCVSFILHSTQTKGYLRCLSWKTLKEDL